MKKIITTVGTSLLSNNEKVSIYLDHLGGYLYEDHKNFEDRIQKLNTVLDSVIQNDNDNLSAEITSILKIQKDLDEQCTVYLLTTDSILAPICARYIQKYFESKSDSNITISFNTELDIVKDLQVKYRKKFTNDGLVRFFSRIREISGEYWDNVVINITGGYKGLIPYSTIIAQINSLPIYYIFQESKQSTPELIKIPPVPLTIDYDGLTNYSKIMNDLMREEMNKDKLDYTFSTKFNSLLENVEIEGVHYVELNPLGKEIWGKYQERFFLFYSPDDVYDDIEKFENIKRILQSKFHNIHQRKSQKRRKQDHDVFKDGKNSFRIFYFEKEHKIFIYKVFEDHDKYEFYLDKVPCSDNIKNEIIRKSKIRQIEITKN